MKNAFWLVFAATLAVYATMLIWILPSIMEAAGGLAPFDMRPLGYSYDEASEFLTALSDDGRSLYLDVQHWLDLFYPALLAATLVLATVLLTAPGWLRWALVVPALLGMVFDYLENFAVGRMLETAADNLAAELVSEASRWTVLKSGFTTVSMVTVIGLLAIRLIARRRA